MECFYLKCVLLGFALLKACFNKINISFDLTKFFFKNSNIGNGKSETRQKITHTNAANWVHVTANIPSKMSWRISFV